MKYNHHMSPGFTLVELLVSVGILVVVMVSVYAFEANIFIYNNESQNQINNTWQAEALLKTMAKELRTMVPSGNGSYPISSVSTSSIIFYANVDNDNEVEQVRYILDTKPATTTLFRGVIQPSGSPVVYTQAPASTTLASGARASSTLPLFQYFDTYYEGTSSPMDMSVRQISDIRLIKINLIIDSDPNRSPVPRTFTTAISLRNLKTNL